MVKTKTGSVKSHKIKNRNFKIKEEVNHQSSALTIIIRIGSSLNVVQQSFVECCGGLEEGEVSLRPCLNKL